MANHPGTTASATAGSAAEHRWTATELRRLPTEQREAIMAAAADAAADEYARNTDLTAFETFGEGDLYGRSSGPAPR